MRFDQTEIPGILETTGYIDLSTIAPDQLAQLIKQKIGPVERKEFFPEVPDRLFEKLKIGRRFKRKREQIGMLAYGFFRHMKLMTILERKILTTAIVRTCPCGPPDNVHLNVDLLSRYTSISPAELKSLFSRLDCLGIRTSIHTEEGHEDGSLVSSEEVITLIYDPSSDLFVGNATFVMLAIFDCLYDLNCEDCSMKAIELLDFSFLSTLSANPEH